MPRFVTIGESKLEYFVFNEAAQDTLLCFHGFAQQGDIFRQVAADNPAKKVIGISLFEHGNSSLSPADTPLTLEYLGLCIANLLKQERIQNFDLAGYSLGARYALGTYLAFAASIKHLYLIAPDGLLFNFWFRAATYNRLSRAVFYWFTHSPKKTERLLNVVASLKLINNSLVKFSHNQLKKPHTLPKVYRAWLSSYRLKMKPDLLNDLSQQHNTTIHFIIAANDPVISAKNMQKLNRKISRSSCTILDKTHLQLANINFLNPRP